MVMLRELSRLSRFSLREIDEVEREDKEEAKKLRREFLSFFIGGPMLFALVVVAAGGCAIWYFGQ
jgi:hypothetical protein